MKRRHGVMIALVVVGLFLAFVYLGPQAAFTIGARALIASIVYRLVRHAIR